MEKKEVEGEKKREKSIEGRGKANVLTIVESRKAIELWN